jgi:hypothetical protein
LGKILEKRKTSFLNFKKKRTDRWAVRYNETDINETDINETDINETDINETDINETDINAKSSTSTDPISQKYVSLTQKCFEKPQLKAQHQKRKVQQQIMPSSPSQRMKDKRIPHRPRIEPATSGSDKSP